MELKRNKKAYFDYQPLETLEAGLVLHGSEVKAAKMGLINLEGSHVVIRNGEAWLIGCKIGLYPKASLMSKKRHNPDRSKKLLLTKREISHLVGSLAQKGLTIVPLFVYSSKHLVKVKIALAKGKRNFDKRAAIKERDYRRRLNSRVR